MGKANAWLVGTLGGGGGGGGGQRRHSGQLDHHATLLGHVAVCKYLACILGQHNYAGYFLKVLGKVHSQPP